MLILWATLSQHPDRSGTVIAKHAYPETTALVPLYDPTLHTVTTHTIVTRPDWTLTVRRPDDQSGGAEDSEIHKGDAPPLVKAFIDLAKEISARG
jgi:hypothetical protein